MVSKLISMKLVIACFLFCGCVLAESKAEAELRAKLAASEAALSVATKDKTALTLALAKVISGTAAVNASRLRADTRADTATANAEHAQVTAELNATEARSAAAEAANTAAMNAAITAKATSWWSTVSAVLATVLPLALFLGGIAKWYTNGQKELFRLELIALIDKANDAQIDKINGTYIRSLGANLTGAEIQRVLYAIEADIDRMQNKSNELHTYAHKWIHDFRNVLAVKAAEELLAKSGKEIIHG